MKTVLPLLFLALVIAVGFVLGDALYIVKETDQVVLTQFGRPVGEAIDTPGLHIKTPFVQKVNRFDKRFLEWDGAPNQITTADKRFIWVDTTARWRISDPLLFFQRLRDESGAQSRLDDILDGATRNSVAKHRLIELVRSTNREPLEIDTPEGAVEDVLVTIDFGRNELAAEILEAGKEGVEDLGIEVLDFRLKRINYVEEVRREVYTRMISERQRIAEQYRSEGQGEAARISGDKARELKRITSEAYRTGKELTGTADAQAADIYAAAYNRSPKVYGFLKTMEVYRETLTSDTSVVLSTEGEFLRYLGEGK